MVQYGSVAWFKERVWKLGEVKVDISCRGYSCYVCDALCIDYSERINEMVDGGPIRSERKSEDFARS